MSPGTTAPTARVSSELIWDRLRDGRHSAKARSPRSVGDADRALAAGDVVGRHLRDAAARARADGAAELHGPRHADVRRGLDRHPGDGARSRGGRQGRRAAREPGHRPQPPARAAASGASSSPTWPTRPRASPSKSTDRSRWSGRARRTSATTIYRPAYHDQLWARLDGGRIVGWKHRITGSAVMARFAAAAVPKGVDADGVDSAAGYPLRHREPAESSSTARSRRASTPASGAASGRTTTSSPSRASSTSWRAGRARTRSRSGARTSAGRPVTAGGARPGAPRSRAGDRRCRRAAGAASPCSRRSPASSPPSSSARWTTPAR